MQLPQSVGSSVHVDVASASQSFASAAKDPDTPGSGSASFLSFDLPASVRNNVLPRSRGSHDHIHQGMSTLTGQQLKDLCVKHGLPSYGTKEVLISRIRAKLGLRSR